MYVLTMIGQHMHTIIIITHGRLKIFYKIKKNAHVTLFFWIPFPHVCVFFFIGIETTRNHQFYELLVLFLKHSNQTIEIFTPPNLTYSNHLTTANEKVRCIHM